jgi:hypothetical protein
VESQAALGILRAAALEVRENHVPRPAVDIWRQAWVVGKVDWNVG